MSTPADDQSMMQGEGQGEEGDSQAEGEDEPGDGQTTPMNA
jgi:hypothetical protein